MKNEKNEEVLILSGIGFSKVTELRITKDVTILGKSKDVTDLLLPFNPSISRMHAKVRRGDTGYFLSDLDSKNGTFLNGIKLKPFTEVELKNEDVIRFSDSSYRVLLSKNGSSHVVISFQYGNEKAELEVPKKMTLSELSDALFQIFHLENKNSKICKIVLEKPFMFIRGNETIEESEIHNGSSLFFLEENI